MKIYVNICEKQGHDNTLRSLPQEQNEALGGGDYENYKYYGNFKRHVLNNANTKLGWTILSNRYHVLISECFEREGGKGASFIERIEPSKQLEGLNIL